MSQSKLKSFFKRKPDDIESSVPSKRPRVTDPLHQELIDIERSSETTTSVTTPTKPKKERKWQSIWETEFKWLRKLTLPEGDQGYCAWCRDKKKSNSVANGCTNIQRSTWVRHENHPYHKMVALAKQPSKQQPTLEKTTDVATTHPCKEAQLRTMFFIIKANLPMHLHTELLNLQRVNGSPDLQDTTKYFTSHQSQTDMVDAINDSVEDTILRDINFSHQLGLIIDETTDITVHKKLCMYIKCLSENNTPVLHFLDNVAVLDGKAVTIVKAIENSLKSKDIPITKISSLATDGASVMMGKHGGVGALLRQQHNPALVQIHCITHRVALAAGQACRDVQYFTDYQLILKQIFKFFNNSAVRYNELRQLQELLDTDDNLKTLSLKQPASFRWLSLGAAVDAIFASYPAIYSTLDSLAAGKDSPEAKGLLQKIKTVTFLLTTAFLKDVLVTVNRLNVIFQRNNLDVSAVMSLVSSTQERLNFYKQKDGPTLTSVYSQINNSQYKDLPLNDKQTLRMQFQNSATAYLTNNNLQQRFEPESLSHLGTINQLLNPEHMPTDNSILTYGEDKLPEILTHFKDSLPIDVSRATTNYLDLKLLLRQQKSLTLQQMATQILNNYSDEYPDFALLYELLLVSPVTSVACERGFSCQNRIKTKLRSRLQPETVSKLMRVQQDGPALADFNPTSSLTKFLDQRNRRK
ncbi:unnamed protein product [Mytilus coruscus]|uniref:DUF4371 domain-containing protein n=1 Tax=Mytilus coruscus TaxID=42192 RepID=A0A6J8CCG7_MYTCO|nr:unnamed protein product [Mytilus coruscus]